MPPRAPPVPPRGFQLHPPETDLLPHGVSSGVPDPRAHRYWFRPVLHGRAPPRRKLYCLTFPLPPLRLIPSVSKEPNKQNNLHTVANLRLNDGALACFKSRVRGKASLNLTRFTVPFVDNSSKRTMLLFALRRLHKAKRSLHVSALYALHRECSALRCRLILRVVSRGMYVSEWPIQVRTKVYICCTGCRALSLPIADAVKWHVAHERLLFHPRPSVAGSSIGHIIDRLSKSIRSYCITGTPRNAGKTHLQYGRIPRTPFVAKSTTLPCQALEQPCGAAARSPP